jgi:hypothetical protein
MSASATKDKILKKETATNTAAAIWSKNNFGPTSHHHPFHKYAPLPVLLIFFKCILEVALQFCPSHLNCVKMVAFQSRLPSGKAGWVGDDSHVAFSQKFLGEKEG